MCAEKMLVSVLYMYKYYVYMYVTLQCTSTMNKCNCMYCDKKHRLPVDGSHIKRYVCNHVTFKCKENLDTLYTLQLKEREIGRSSLIACRPALHTPPKKSLETRLG